MRVLLESDGSVQLGIRTKSFDESADWGAPEKPEDRADKLLSLREMLNLIKPETLSLRLATIWSQTEGLCLYQQALVL